MCSVDPIRRLSSGLLEIPLEKSQIESVQDRTVVQKVVAESALGVA
jgi:hypothetical protein